MRKGCQTTALPPQAQAAWVGALLTGSAGLFAIGMGPRLVSQLSYGPICSGHGSPWAPHCAACYAAAALAAAGLLMGVNALMRRGAGRA